MTTSGSWGNDAGSHNGVREPGSRRTKLAGYLRAANELRQTYQQSYNESWGKHGLEDSPDHTQGASSNATVTRSGEDEMVIFPGYASRHIKRKPKAVPGTIQESAGAGRDVRDTIGSGDAQFWRDQWDEYEDDHAVVDVEIRGWLYCPHRGPLTRKHRLFVGLARQMVGIPAPSGKNGSGSTTSSRAASPHTFREVVEAKTVEKEQKLVANAAASLVETGDAEAVVAGQGGYSEEAEDDTDLNPSLTGSRGSSRERSRENGQIQACNRPPSEYDEPRNKPPDNRVSWTVPSQMSAAELSSANYHLMHRLGPFLANPLASTPISAFFYNENVSRQKTIDTDASGHFTIRAALDFVPTHVRILASGNLSVTEEIIIIEPNGVSVISDIDDTIKHSAIGSGAREIFRNVFIRDFRDLIIDGVKDWYTKIFDMGVKFHYVSNSPWQLFPVLSAFFAMAGLPPGSFHLKQYSGVFQGIFEPVAERKKSTLEKILHDFPERRFILVGDSGEADLEVYTDVVLEHPGRVLGIFIRDVTTSLKTEFFDSSMTGQGVATTNNSHGVSAHERISESYQLHNGGDHESQKSDMATSLRDMDRLGKENGRPGSVAELRDQEQRPKLPPRTRTEPAPPEEDLIDLDYDDNMITRADSQDTDLAQPSTKLPLQPPRPEQVTDTSTKVHSARRSLGKTPPPVPRKPSTSVDLASLSSQRNAAVEDPSKAPPMPARPKPAQVESSYTTMARQKLASAYSHLPSPYAYLYSAEPQVGTTKPPSISSIKSSSPDKTSEPATTSEETPPPVPPRRPISSYPAAAAQYASSLYNSATSTDPLATSYGGGTANPVNKREELWKRRWTRAKEILDSKGVMLRSWRVGTDVMDTGVSLVEKADEEQAKAGHKIGNETKMPSTVTAKTG